MYTYIYMCIYIYVYVCVLYLCVCLWVGVHLCVFQLLCGVLIQISANGYRVLQFVYGRRWGWGRRGRMMSRTSLATQLQEALFRHTHTHTHTRTHAHTCTPTHVHTHTHNTHIHTHTRTHTQHTRTHKHTYTHTHTHTQDSDTISLVRYGLIRIRDMSRSNESICITVTSEWVTSEYIRLMSHINE